VKIKEFSKKKIPLVEDLEKMDKDALEMKKTIDKRFAD